MTVEQYLRSLAPVDQSRTANLNACAIRLGVSLRTVQLWIEHRNVPQSKHLVRILACLAADARSETVALATVKELVK